jgi:hypothetical protein
MRIAREYITYLARVLAVRLPAEKLISTPDEAGLQAAIHQALETEFGVEDRINEEARTILASHAEAMQKLGASYGDSFKKIKAELVRKHKAVL